MRIAIIGAGVIGLSCALEFARRGADVRLFDKATPGRGASWAAAGMLAPGYEAAGPQSAHPRMLELCLESAALWPGFAKALEAETGTSLGYEPGPSMAVAYSKSDSDDLSRLESELKAAGLAFRSCTPREVLRLEPALRASPAQAILLETDGQVDNRALVTALLHAVKSRGVDFTPPHGDEDAILVACGWQAGECEPVKGQLLSLRREKVGQPGRVIQAGHLYIVPKADRVVIGATEEPGVKDLITDPSDTETLRLRAIEICPGLADPPVLERWAGLRPATPDRAPILGQRHRGTFVATGHYRNGILLAPITAKLMADFILKGEVSDLAAAFAPGRFETT